MQLMKQLTQNPSPESTAKGWQLMALALQCFPPDSMVEHFLEKFLRDHATPHPTAYIYLMYRTVRRGPLRKALSPQKLQAMLLIDCSKERAGALNPLLLADDESSPDPRSQRQERATPRLENPINMSGRL